LHQALAENPKEIVKVRIQDSRQRKDYPRNHNFYPDERTSVARPEFAEYKGYRKIKQQGQNGNEQGAIPDRGWPRSTAHCLNQTTNPAQAQAHKGFLMSVQKLVLKVFAFLGYSCAFTHRHSLSRGSQAALVLEKRYHTEGNLSKGLAASDWPQNGQQSTSSGDGG